ncbi:MAG: molybdopterin-dependent oxidoreductase [Mailhella sp.]|nr:molybdopterin-dependent oxidoreductase [Mailhella sp.]
MRSDGVLAKKQLTIRPYDAVHYGICANCASGCSIKSFMNGATHVDFFGDEEHPLNKGSLCPKGLMVYHTHEHKARLLSPSVRDNAAAAWNTATWNAAVAAVAGKIAELGPDAVVALPASTLETMDYVAGAEWFASAVPGAVAPSAFVPEALGPRGPLASMFGLSARELCMNSQRDWAASKAILVVGGDMAAESPATFGPLEDARDRGRQLLYIGSCGGMTAMRSSAALLVQPGTEAFAVGSIVHCILRDGKENKSFLADFADGLDDLRDAVAALDPVSAARICNVDAAEIEKFAAILSGKAPISVKPSAALDASALSLCGALVAICGSIGVPGGGLNMPAVTPFRSGAETSVSLEQLLLEGKCQAVIGFGDWASRLSGGEKVRKALKACKLIVHIGSFDDATRALAHVSLPAAHWSEYASLRDVSDSRAIQWSGAMLAPAGDSRAPLAIWTDLVNAVAPEARAPWAEAAGETDQQRLASYLLASNPLTAGITLADLAADEHKSSGGVQWPCASAADVELEVSRFLRANIRGCNVMFKPFSEWPGTSFRFPTENGRIQLGAAIAPQKPAVNRSALFLVLSGQVLHAVNHPAVVLRDGLPVASINPQSAVPMGLKAGDKIVISTDEASVTASVRTSWSACPGTVNMEPEAAAALLPVNAGTVAVQVKKA